MKVRFIKDHLFRGKELKAGREEEFTNELGRELIKAGACEEIIEVDLAERIALHNQKKAEKREQKSKK